MSSIQRAREVQTAWQQQIRESCAGLSKNRRETEVFATAAKALATAEAQARELIPEVNKMSADDIERFTLSAKRAAARNAYDIKLLLPFFAKKLLAEIKAKDILEFQRARKKQGAANATINHSVGFLRKLLRKHGEWARLSPDVKILPTNEEVGVALSKREQRILLEECSRAGTRLLLPLVTLAMETGARYSTITCLRWKGVNLDKRCAKLGRDKTKNGDFRSIPLSTTAHQVLQAWAESFPDRTPEDFVFPSERGVGKLRQPGDREYFAEEFRVDKTKHVDSVRTSWESAKKRTRYRCDGCAFGILVRTPEDKEWYACETCFREFETLPVALSRLRFHDLRHTAASRMAEAGVPLPVIGRILGWSPATLARMIHRYGHYQMEALHEAVEKISGSGQLSHSFTPDRALLKPSQTSNDDTDELPLPKPPVNQSRWNREVLYKQVWEKPLQEVAAGYNVSDVAIGKVCRARRVPLPGRGYWNKLRAGLPVPDRPPLPPADGL